MHRKEFLKNGWLIFTPIISQSTGVKQQVNYKQHLKLPAYLTNGGSIGITAPAGYITLPEIESCITMLTSWGFQVIIGNTIGKKDGTLGGTDAERLDDMQQMLDAENIAAIMCARGGYGLVRIIDKLQWKKFTQYPKWIIGFSDITYLHGLLQHHIGFASIHSKMCNSFPSDFSVADDVVKASILSIKQALIGDKTNIFFPAINQQINGTAKGILVGGNLKIIESMAASKSAIVGKGKILFVEDTGEYLYSIDRMFWQLQRSGVLANINGLIIGGFKVKLPDDVAENFNKTLEEIVLEKVLGYGYPVAFNFPVGHQKHNMALKCGVMHQLNVGSTNNLIEI